MLMIAILFVIGAFLCGPECGFDMCIIPNFTVKKLLAIYNGYIALMLLLFFVSILLDFFQP